MSNMNSLKFQDLRQANIKRIPLFKDAQGRVCHNADGSDWTLGEWCNAITGELGEAANLIKKVRRGDVTLDDEIEVKGHGRITVRHALALEYADVACYLDILAFRTGVDLGEAVREKFNFISERVGVDIKL